MDISAVDPFGTQVSIPEDILPPSLSIADGNDTDSPMQVIQRPAILLTNCESEPGCCTSEPCENHYLRLINATDTLLISAQKIDGKWIAYNCLHNPSAEQLAPLIINNRQLK